MVKLPLAILPLTILSFLAGCAAPLTVTCGCAALWPIPSPETLLQKAGDRVFFAYDKAVLSPTSRGTLDRQIALLTQTAPGQNVQIAGNTDERGTETYNLALGQRRADAVRDYLVAGGVAPGRIKAISYGKDRPLNDWHDETHWRLNRNAITSVPGFIVQYPP